MRFLAIIPRDKNATALGGAGGIAAMQKYKEQLVQADILVASNDLLPTQQGAKIRFETEGATVIDGPFTESEDLVAGFWLLDTRSKDEAIAALRRAPFPPGTEIVVRQIFSAPYMRRPPRAARRAGAKRADRL